MPVSRAQRRATLSAYRRLFRAAHTAARDCGLSDPTALPRFVSARFAAAAATATATATAQEKSRAPRGRRAAARRHTAPGLSVARAMAARLEGAAESPALAAMLRALAARVGNAPYQRALEMGFARHGEFAQRDAERRAHDAGATAERQNRVMQHALMPYGERLQLLHRIAPGGLTAKSAAEMMAGARSGVSAHYVAHGAEHAMVEVDEAHSRQVVYVRCAAHDWGRRDERVAAAEPEELRGTLLHAEFSATAARLCDALIAEAPLHAYRATVVVGHGEGGAVGLCLALLLHARGFEVTNCVTLGAPKAIVTTLHRYVHAITPVRIVLEGDPLVDLPVTAAEGDAFVHHGEVLCMAGGTVWQGETDAQEEKGEEEKADAERRAADALADMLETDCGATGIHSDSDGATNHGGDHYLADPDAMSGKPFEDYASEDKEENVENDDEDEYDDEAGADEEGDMTARARLAAQRYEAGYTLDHYVERLLDSTTPLTYAEGEDVWDEGDYAKTRRESPMPHKYYSNAAPPI